MIEFDQTPDVHFFLCCECRTHIALNQELLFTVIENDFGIFRNTVNVDVEDDPRRHSIVGIRTAADASCTRCSQLLGFKLIVIPDENMVIQAGRFILDLTRLLLWNGSRILYAHDHSPVED
ncbi:Protein yippee-like [Actinidia chinensis var. chinensis]|uniref:Protein yippee-like n=1 Tax=Actinidia chinensis var. chinensis TaxID=1590841 RepID=A0A2R6RU84_ACTCC|nr:Protein yippee-like [Actinidia chinensis var. chinensis]